MLLPPFRRSCAKHSPAGIRLARLFQVLNAAQTTSLYGRALRDADLTSPQRRADLCDAESTLALLPPTSLAAYQQSLATLSLPPQHQQETRAGLLLPYREARSGLTSWAPYRHALLDLSSTPFPSQAAGDLYSLARALSPFPTPDWQSDHALVIFSGPLAGVLTEARRDIYWERFQVPLFEHFVSAEAVLAAECEIHCGLHIRPEAALLETVEGEILMTSLTDLKNPALRVRTGLRAVLEESPCECGRLEPRLCELAPVLQPQFTAVFA